MYMIRKRITGEYIKIKGTEKPLEFKTRDSAYDWMRPRYSLKYRSNYLDIIKKP